MPLTKNTDATETAGLNRRNRLIFVSCVLLSLGASAVWGGTSKEQTVFEAAPYQRIRHPVHLPQDVLQLLAKDNHVSDCMKDNPIPRSGSLANWFTASEIHLSKPTEDDLVVLPTAQGHPHLCFHSVEGIGWFWVFRQVGAHYELVLKTAGLGLTIRDTRHNGYKEIQSGAAFGTHRSETTYRFENGTYREFRRDAQ